MAWSFKVIPDEEGTEMSIRRMSNSISERESFKVIPDEEGTEIQACGQGSVLLAGGSKQSSMRWPRAASFCLTVGAETSRPRGFKPRGDVERCDGDKRTHAVRLAPRRKIGNGDTVAQWPPSCITEHFTEFGQRIPVPP